MKKRNETKKKMNTGKKVAILMLVLAVLIFAASGIFYYLNQYYPAQKKAQDVYIQQEQVTYTVENLEDYDLFLPKGCNVTDCDKEAIIFYPGGKVEETAYAPLLKEFATAGYPVFLMKMPFRLAVFDVNAADKVLSQYPNRKWIMMGHSLGGAMAASYTKDHLDEIDGLVLLAAYSTADFSETNLKVLSVYGSNDQVLSKEKYAKYQTNLPASAVEYEIEGGNHANYGYYGEQKGDGTATILPKEQQQQVVDQFLGIFSRG